MLELFNVYNAIKAYVVNFFSWLLATDEPDVEPVVDPTPAPVVDVPATDPVVAPIDPVVTTNSDDVDTTPAK